MTFLLHKDIKENKEIATAQMAQLVPSIRDLVLPDTKANASQNQKSHFLPKHGQTTEHKKLNLKTEKFK